ncbi:hypothetical protein GCM10027610_073440 [Dactylosporangium cerinum]
MDGYTGGGVIGGGMATGGGLALTGANTVWVVLAGFAFVAVGAALLRIAPKVRSRRNR